MMSNRLKNLQENWWKILARTLIGGALFIAGMWLIPHRWCARQADDWYEGHIENHKKLANGLEDWLGSHVTTNDFDTGYDLFDGEWLFGTYMMAGMGFGQSAIEHPDLREKHLELMSTCIKQVLSPEVREFDKHSWKNDPIESLDGDSGHAAYLGYFNLVLGLHRLLDPESEFAPLNDRITEALTRRLEKSPLTLLETYPKEVYPVDNCAVIGSIGLHGTATGTDHDGLIRKWVERCRRDYVDSQTGLLFQCIDPDTGKPADHPRGSGTAFGSYFLSFADIELSRDLYKAVRKELAGTFLGFGVVKEYPRTVRGGRGDIDSGPIILGYSISATGFSVGCSRIHKDRSYFSKLFSTAYFFGAPLEHGNRWEYVTGGPLGNAIMFAMLTAKAVPDVKKDQ